MLLLDTMVVSERTKARPDRKVQAWLTALPPPQQFLSVISIGEIRFGIHRLPPCRDKQRLEHWLINELTPFFAGRVLPVDEPVAERWGRMRHDVGRTVSPADALIAATARVHNLTVATRNEREFTDLGVPVINPWAT